MWIRIEPIVKYLFLLFMLKSLLLNRYKNISMIVLTLFYGTVVMVLIYKITVLPVLKTYSYYTFLLLMFLTAAIWAILFLSSSIKLVLPYLLFYMNCIVCIRVFSDAFPSFLHSKMNIAGSSLCISVILLSFTNFIFIKNRILESTYITNRQYGMVLFYPCITFASYEVWRIYGTWVPAALVWIALCHYIINLLMLTLISMTIRDYRQIIRLSIMNKKQEIEIAEIKNNAELVQQCHRIRHEFKNVCFYMQIMLKESNYKKLEAFLSKYIGENLSYNKNINTGSHLIDMILCQKMEEARLNGIPISAKVKINSAFTIEENEICTVLINLLDNAIETSKKEMDSDICIELNVVKSFMAITVKNRVSYDVLAINPLLRTTKGNAEFHGIGMSVIRDIVKKHKGKLEFYMKDKYFIVNIFL